jgi:hypothetical protein
VNSIGPNFRPPGQQGSAAGARQNEGVQQPGTQQQGNFPEPIANRTQSGMVPGTLSLAALLAQQNPLAPDQLAQLLRNLLKMPKEIVQFLALLAEQDPAAGQELLQQLMTEEVKIPLESLQSTLEGKLDQAQQKLLKLVQGNPVALASNGELGELMKGLSELTAKTGKAPAEALQSTITLYLPFYPLHPPQAFSLRFEPPNGEGEGSNEDEPQLVVYIETLTLGQFRASIATGPQSQWKAVIEHDTKARDHLDAIQANLKEAAPLEQPELFFLSRAGQETVANPTTSVESNSSTASTGQQSVGLHPTGGVSVLAVHAAYLLIRVILELDNQNALHQGRAKL